ncbi:MAG TPA: glycoside hydrolase, partial [Cyclobacteriaceae bacterium]|nr:glycoside hydrolase [Cyclobacteriaceae bacterium]
LANKKDGIYIVYSVCEDAMKGGVENELVISKVTDKTIYLRVTVSKNAKCVFSYSLDGKKYEGIKSEFQARPGRWVGAKMGLFATRTSTINDAGYADFDWFRIGK